VNVNNGSRHAVILIGKKIHYDMCRMLQASLRKSWNILIESSKRLL